MYFDITLTSKMWTNTDWKHFCDIFSFKMDDIARYLVIQQCTNVKRKIPEKDALTEYDNIFPNNCWKVKLFAAISWTCIYTYSIPSFQLLKNFIRLGHGILDALHGVGEVVGDVLQVLEVLHDVRQVCRDVLQGFVFFQHLEKRTAH